MDTDKGADAGPPRSVISRVDRLLTSFDGENDRLTLTQLALRSGLATTTTHRMLSELVSTGLLSKNESGLYSIGTRLWEVGESSAISLRLRETALPYLLTLYEATAENVHLAVLDGYEALYVAHLVGPHSIPTISRMGGRLPLQTTGVGKALLAYQDDRFLTGFFARRLERPTKYSLTSQARIRSQLAEIRRSGYARTDQEMTLGNTSLAVPIFDRGDLPIAAVGVVTHTVRADVSRLVPVLRKAATGISRDLRELSDQRDVSAKKDQG